MSRCKANPCCGDPIHCVVPRPQHITGLNPSADAGSAKNKNGGSLSASYPTFSRGHCFMSELFSRPEVESVGELVHAHMKANFSDMEPAELRRWQKILRKMDYPDFDIPPFEIHFEDKGQDLIRIVVNATTGVIEDAGFHSNLYVDEQHVVDVERLMSDRYVYFTDPKGRAKSFNCPVVRLEQNGKVLRDVDHSPDNPSHLSV